MGRVKINSYFTAREFWPPARRERRAYPARGSVRNEQRSPRPKEPAGKCEVIFARPQSNEIAITSTKWLHRLMRGFRSTVRQIATGLAGGGVFNGNANRKVITRTFLNDYDMLSGSVGRSVNVYFSAAQMKSHRGVQSASAMFHFISRPQWHQSNLVPAQFQARVARI